MCSYKDVIHHSRLLSKEENIKMIKKAQAGDLEARNAVILANALLITFSMKRHYNFVYSNDDLFSCAFCAGVFGLERAIAKYNSKKGAFSSYAMWWIRSFVGRHLTDETTLIGIPVYQYELQRRVRQNAASNKDIKEDAIFGVRGIASLDDPIGGGSSTIGSVLSGDTEDFRKKIVMEATIERLLGELEDREKMVICKRFGLMGHKVLTLRTLGKMYGLSKERIRQIEVVAIQKLKEFSESKEFSSCVELLLCS